MAATAPAPFYREAGSGPGIVCLHSNASTSSQWSPLMEELADRWHVLAVDSFGAGQSRWPPHDGVAWATRRRLSSPCSTARHAAGSGRPFLRRCRRADRRAAPPARVRALALYEPTLFALVDAERAPPNDADGIRDAVARRRARSTPATPTPRPRTSSTTGWERAAGATRRPSASRRSPRRCATCGAGRRPCSASDAARRVSLPRRAGAVHGRAALDAGGARRRASALRCAAGVERIEFEEAGHMGPVTHAAAVNAAIAASPTGWQR